MKKKNETTNENLNRFIFLEAFLCPFRFNTAKKTNKQTNKQKEKKIVKLKHHCVYSNEHIHNGRGKESYLLERKCVWFEKNTISQLILNSVLCARPVG